MRNVVKKIRTAYYTALSGVISVPVVDGWNNADSLVTNHVIIKNITENKKDNTQQTWGSEVIVELDIVTYQKNGFTSDTRDNIEDEILQIVFPTISNVGITISGMGLYNVEKLAAHDLEEESDNGNIARKILRIKQDVHQN